ncbi:transglutaminase domain protein [Methanocorpusculum labreanum Z]|uniref:Transglutaminase domain protein n=1 Tax=Methanocorpusculum labreanum (strain ATCC 43576 / DSM 4855 / Z) TaxID=410358 RepID=A2SSB8_METLZ|nr:transglutaminase family protein [Methanocorpusculum labreanum]ABN07224.1 transglutaminase domain protein [Methanocorpusculum labreanum Z]
MDMHKFLREDPYIDFSHPLIREKVEDLFSDLSSDIEKTRKAYEFVRDEIPHSFDIQADIITAKASDVLKFRTGICHAKANLLAALLRSEGIPTGFCFQHLTLAGDDSLGYCVHCFNAVFLQKRWIKLDARGNINGKDAQFSLETPILAFQNRTEYDEYFWKGIYAAPHPATMQVLDTASSLKDVVDNFPETITETPDIHE